VSYLRFGLASLTLVGLLSASALGQDAPSSSDKKPEAALGRLTTAVCSKLAPSVVTIEALGGLPKRFKAPKNEGEKRKGILARRGFKQAAGPSTGLIVRADGLIVTSTFPLVRKPRHLFVTLQDGRSFVARLLGADESRKLALLKIDAKGLPVPRFAPRAQVQVGRFALALGRGLGTSEPAASLGIVSALGRVGGRAIQSSAAISPVNYGGPLVGIDGSILGILVPLDLQGRMAGVDIYDSGIGFAIPIQDVVELIPRLTKGGKLERAFLGLVPDESHRGQGIRVGQVAPGSPAAKAGIKRSDIVLSLDDEKTNETWQLRRALGRRFAGEVVEVAISRGGEVVKLEVQLTAPAGPRPPGPKPAQPQPKPKPGQPKPGQPKPSESTPGQPKPKPTKTPAPPSPH
jgi:serine protease Do